MYDENLPDIPRSSVRPYRLEVQCRTPLMVDEYPEDTRGVQEPERQKVAEEVVAHTGEFVEVALAVVAAAVVVAAAAGSI
jgi:hypothetical protein